MTEMLNGPQVINPNRPPTFRECVEAAGGTERDLYVKRLKLAKKPVAEWTEEEVRMAMVCTFPWMQWMQLIRNGGEW